MFYKSIPNMNQIDAVFQKLLSGHQILITDGRTHGHGHLNISHSNQMVNNSQTRAGRTGWCSPKSFWTQARNFVVLIWWSFLWNSFKIRLQITKLWTGPEFGMYGRTDWRTDGQPGDYMLPWNFSGSIKKHNVVRQCVTAGKTRNVSIGHGCPR